MEKRLKIEMEKKYVEPMQAQIDALAARVAKLEKPKKAKAKTPKSKR